MTVARARAAARLGAELSLIAVLIAWLIVLRRLPLDEPSRIQARYGQLLVPVTRSDRRSYDEVIEVESMETLTKLAERYDRMILHEHNELGHSYRIADEGVLYVYLIGSRGPAGQRPALPTIAADQADARSPG
jgi:hypothetical protein